MISITLPELGEGITSAVIACWHVGLGDQVKKNDDLVEIVTDKASFNIPTTETGVVKAILATEGQEVLIGQELAIIKNNE